MLTAIVLGLIVIMCALYYFCVVAGARFDDEMERIHRKEDKDVSESS